MTQLAVRDEKPGQPSRLPVFVTPCSARRGIGGWRTAADGRDELEVRVAAAPTDGAANEELLKLLSKALGVSRSELTIISGETSRHKRIDTPFEPRELQRRLDS
jgi:uncharacterized protein (TIGR00251 family)